MGSQGRLQACHQYCCRNSLPGDVPEREDDRAVRYSDEIVVVAPNRPRRPAVSCKFEILDGPL